MLHRLYLVSVTKQFTSHVFHSFIGFSFYTIGFIKGPARGCYHFLSVPLLIVVDYTPLAAKYRYNATNRL